MLRRGEEDQGADQVRIQEEGEDDPFGEPERGEAETSGSGRKIG